MKFINFHCLVWLVAMETGFLKKSVRLLKCHWTGSKSTLFICIVTAKKTVNQKLTVFVLGSAYAQHRKVARKMTSLAKATPSTLSLFAWNAKAQQPRVIYQNKLVGLEKFLNAKPNRFLILFSYTRPKNLKVEFENCQKSMNFVNDLDLSRWPWPLMKLAWCQFGSLAMITYNCTFKPKKYLPYERRNRLFSKSMIFHVRCHGNAIFGKCPTVPRWHSSDSDSTPFVGIETAKKLLLSEMSRFFILRPD